MRQTAFHADFKRQANRVCLRLVLLFCYLPQMVAHANNIEEHRPAPKKLRYWHPRWESLVRRVWVSDLETLCEICGHTSWPDTAVCGPSATLPAYGARKTMWVVLWLRKQCNYHVLSYFVSFCWAMFLLASIHIVLWSTLVTFKVFCLRLQIT